MRTKILFGVFLVFLGFHLVHLCGLTDDSYISYRYSRNLAQGHGLRWNIDEEPVEGYTNFLWILIGTAVYMGAPSFLPLIMQILGIILFLAALWLFYRILLPVFAGRESDVWPFLFLFAASGPLVLWATSGLETPLFMFLILAVFYRYQRLPAEDDLKAESGLWTLTFLAFLARPDGILVGAVIGFERIILLKGWKRPRAIIPLVLFFLFPFIAYNAWRFFYFHALLPNTFHAKATGAPLLQVKKGLLYLGDFGWACLLPLIPLWFALVLRSRDKSRGETFSLPWLRPVLVFLALFTAYIVYVGGDYMSMFRFFVPLLPLIYLVSAAWFRWRGARLEALVWLAILITLLPSTPLDKPLFGGNKTYHYGGWEGFKTERWYIRRYEAIGRALDRAVPDKSASVVIPAIGAVGYFSGLDVLDYYGLTDRVIARMKRKAFAGNFPGHEKTDIDYILSRKPTILMGYKRFTPNRVGIEHPMFKDYYVQGDLRRWSLIRDHYRVRNIWVNDRGNRESGYLTFLELKKRE